eukprot:652845-Rhodomonas_salina.5
MESAGLLVVLTGVSPGHHAANGGRILLPSHPRPLFSTPGSDTTDFSSAPTSLHFKLTFES